ncbi:acidic mammalian chitinase-like [Ylistrum balloti]|uniref:acidic mammalian chitinase-like n=1 Tax=Ylistrum balloti TaxID=509963 RepID=UPI0029058921|nr:acidic mammalian chitinase-like [Ylistrum balloti]
MAVLRLLLCVVVIFYLSEFAFGFRRVCFYDGWAAQRTGDALLTPDMIDPFLCTHLIFSHAIVRKNNKWEIYRRLMVDTNNYRLMNNLTLINPDLKTLVLLTEQDPGDFDNMAVDSTNRTTFINSVIPFLKKYNFGGLSLQWRGSSSNFKLMSTELRQAFDNEFSLTNDTFLFTADLVGPLLDDFNNNYELSTIKETALNFDFITLQTWNLFDATDDSVTRHHSRRVPRSDATGKDKFLNMKGIADYLAFLGIPKSSMNIGIATFGRAYQLVNSSDFDLGSAVTGLASQSSATETPGLRGYYEICKLLEDGTGSMFRDEGVPYYVNGLLWVGYDDIESVTEKTNWITEEGYGGGSIRGLSMDDFSEHCNSSGRPFPLINTIKDIFDEAVAPREYRRVCYFSTWAADRYGPGRFTVNEVDEFLCTHVIVAFAEISDDNQIQASTLNDTYTFHNATKLRTNNPDLKVLLSVGGWEQGSSRFSHMVSGPKRRRDFAASVISFLRLYAFDGLDLAWQYPTQRQGSADTDKKNFGILLDVITGQRREFDNEPRRYPVKKLLLTAAVAAEQEHIDYAYDVKALSDNLDFLSLQTFDMRGYWDWQTGHHSQLKPFPWETGPDANLNMEWSGKYWHMLGVDKEKINIGMATFGRGFELSYAPDNSIGAWIDGPNPAGNLTDEDGFLAYYEICDLVDDGNGNVMRVSGVPYYVYDRLWIGYDDEQSIANKVQWLVNEGFGGAMVWSMDLDDFRQTCASSTSPSPLINTIKDMLTGYVSGSVTDKVTTDSTTEESTTMSSTTTPGPHIDCDVQPIDGPYPNPRNNRNFYKCSNGEAFLYWCPSNLVFNQTMLVCDYP